MKKPFKLILILTLTLFLCLSLAACSENDGNNTAPQTFDINNESDFLAISNMLGEDYSQTVFNLKSDLSFEGNWSPIGQTMENSFRGKLLGNGHTISLTVDEYSLEGNVFAIFGYAYDGYFENLNIVVSYNLYADATSSYVGALTAVSYGNSTFKDIDISASVYLEPKFPKELLDLERDNLLDDSDIDAIEFNIDKISYIGGLGGLIIGKASITGINSDFSLNVPIIEHRFGYYNFTNSFQSVYAGSVCGILRTNDISQTNTERLSLEDITANPRFEINGQRIYAGGVIGMIYNTNALNIAVTSDSALGAHGLKHTVMGGAFGLCDNTAIDNIVVELDLAVVPKKHPGRDTSSCFGGIVGYVNNNSLLTNGSYLGKIKAMAAENTESFGGGIAGVVSNSTLSNLTVTGGFELDNYSTPEALMVIFNDYSYSMVMLRHYAGVAGRLHGNALLENIACDFISYQGIVAIITPIINTVSDEETNKVVDVEITVTPKILDDVTYYEENTVAHFYDLTGLDEEKFQSNGYGTIITKESEEE